MVRSARSFPGSRSRSATTTGEPVEPAAKAASWIKTPAATVGYWDDPDATEAVFSDGWLDSGDVMRADDDGYFWFCGRKKQIIVHDGSNICPQEVEGALLEHPSVESAGVIGIHDLVHGENVRAYITLHDGLRAPGRPGADPVRARAVGYKAPEEIVVLDEMPLTATGKLDRTASSGWPSPPYTQLATAPVAGDATISW